MERSLLAAGGVPAALAHGGSDHRDAWRGFLSGAVAPAARLLSDELRRIGLDPAISFAGIMASDLQPRSRAYKQLIDAGMDDGEARKICGFA